MEIIKSLNIAIDYIENRLDSTLNIDEIAKIAFTSRYHFQRVFHALTGFTLAEYIRNRRLTLAAEELSCENFKIIDIAFKYGYESSDAFTKAFQRQHGITPSTLKKVTDELLKYKEMYDEIFVAPLNIDALNEQRSQKHFLNLSFLIDGRVQGGCTVFEKDGFGYVETIYVLPEKRGTGLSKDIVTYIFNYFLSKGLKKTKLEVWELNKRAVKLYEFFGYKEVKKNLMFPGIAI